MPVNEEMTIEDAIRIAKVICLKETGTERTAIQMLIDEAERLRNRKFQRLKPCPCCGGAAISSIRFNEYSQIETEIKCSNCYMSAKSQWAYDPGDSLPRIREAFDATAAAWNRRDFR